MNTSRTRLGMLLFVASEGVFFLLLILAYVMYHREQGNGPTAAGSLDVLRTGVFSVFLLASSATMALAGRQARNESRTGFLGALAVTALLGSVFLAGQGWEYAQLLHEGVTISRDLFGTTFFTLTGFHGLHVLLGLLLMGSLLISARPGTGLPRSGALEAVSIYWHFVDAVWVVIFGVVYLWALL